MPLEEGGRRKARGAVPGRGVRAAAREEGLKASERRWRPDEIATAECHDVVDVAAQVEARPQRQDRREGEARRHQVEGLGRGQCRRDDRLETGRAGPDGQGLWMRSRHLATSLSAFRW